jgi:C4-dicarboxylate transporter DctQ subunit
LFLRDSDPCNGLEKGTPMKLLDRLEEWLIAILMGGATLLIFVAVIHRYAACCAPIAVVQDLFLKIDLSWAQELCIYMFVWMAKFGAAYGVRTGIHVGVDVLINQLPPRWRKAYVLVGLILGAVFTGIIASFGAYFTWGMAHTDQTSPDLEIPKWIVYLCIPLGSGLMCFRFLQVAWAFARMGGLPKHDVAHVEGVDLSASPALHPVEGTTGVRP